jgi:hypothetical protein
MLVALGCLVAVTSALGDEIPGATYTGTLPDGATVEFKVSADGSRLVAYRISDVQGDTCKFVAQGREGSWEGTPVTNHAFHYTLYVNSVDFQGRFDGAQSATGTFRLHNDAVEGVKPACDSGTVNWTATTASPSPSAPGSDEGGGPGTGGAGYPASGGTSRKSFHTSLTLRRKDRRTLAGRITSASSACRIRRRVVLKRGSRTIASAVSKADGSFRFARSNATRGRTVRASAPARSGSTATCNPGSSKPVRA